MISILYWLAKSNYHISLATFQKLESMLINQESNVTQKSWLRLLNVYSNMNQKIDYCSYETFKQNLRKIKPANSAEAIQAALDLCKIMEYDKKIWENIIHTRLDESSDYLNDLKIIKLALEIEATYIAESSCGEIIKNCIQSTIAQNVNTNTLAKERYIDISYLDLIKLHREVEYVLRTIFDYTENYNYLDTFIIDFFNEKENFGFDLHCAQHYFHPDIGDRHDMMRETRMIGIMKLKKRLLDAKKLTVMTIPYYEWNRYAGNTEKLIYLNRKFRYGRPKLKNS